MSIASGYEKASRKDQEAYDRERADAESDREAYHAALNVAEDELDRVNDYMRGKHTFQVPAADRVRREHLCQAVIALRALVKNLGTY